MGIPTLFDKSFLQSLTVDESVLFDQFFIAVISPLFYVETMADLDKVVRSGRTSEDEVRIIADKAPEMHGQPCPHHVTMCMVNLTGYQVPMDGRPPIPPGQSFVVEGRRAVFSGESPETEAFKRWMSGNFAEIELRFAKNWRTALNALDLSKVAAGMNAIGVNPQSCKSLAQARELAQAFVLATDRPRDRMNLAFIALGLPQSYEDVVYDSWNRSGYPPLPSYAPYFAHVLAVDAFFHIALGARLIGSGKASNRIDIGYLSYLPFCKVFVSSDGLHRRTAPHFLRADQRFVWGPDLKNDLGRLVKRYTTLPQSEQDKGLYHFAALPPLDDDFLVSGLWDQYEEGWRSPRFTLADLPPEFAAEMDTLFQRFQVAAVSPRDDVAIHTKEPDMLSIERYVRKKKGSFYQGPKDAEV